MDPIDVNNLPSKTHKTSPQSNVKSQPFPFPQLPDSLALLCLSFISLPNCSRLARASKYLQQLVIITAGKAKHIVWEYCPHDLTTASTVHYAMKYLVNRCDLTKIKTFAMPAYDFTSYTTSMRSLETFCIHDWCSVVLSNSKHFIMSVVELQTLQQLSIEGLRLECHVLRSLGTKLPNLKAVSFTNLEILQDCGRRQCAPIHEMLETMQKLHTLQLSPSDGDQLLFFLHPTFKGPLLSLKRLSLLDFKGWLFPWKFCGMPNVRELRVSNEQVDEITFCCAVCCLERDHEIFPNLERVAACETDHSHRFEQKFCMETYSEEDREKLEIKRF